MEITKTHWFWTGDRREVKAKFHDAEIDRLLNLAKQGRDEFSKTLVRKLEAAIR